MREGIGQAEVDYLDVVIVVEEEVLRLQISMYDVQFVKIFYSSNDLVKEFEGLRLLNTLVLDDVVEELASIRILHDKIELLWRLNDFVQLDDIGMANHLQNMDFSCNSLNIIDILDLVFFENFDRHSFTGELMHSKFDLAECAFSDRFI